MTVVVLAISDRENTFVGDNSYLNFLLASIKSKIVAHFNKFI